MTHSQIIVRTAGIEFVGTSFDAIIEDMEIKISELQHELNDSLEDPYLVREYNMENLEGQQWCFGVELTPSEKEIASTIFKIEAEIKNLKQLTNNV